MPDPMNMVITNALKLKLAADSTGNDTASGSLYHMRAGLYRTVTDNTPDSIKGDFDSSSATFTGYGADTITWQAPTVADDGSIECLGSLPAWMASDTVTPNTIAGLYCWCADNTLAMSGQFPNQPIGMAGPLDQLTVTLRYRPDASVPVVVIS